MHLQVEAQTLIVQAKPVSKPTGHVTVGTRLSDFKSLLDSRTN